MTLIELLIEVAIIGIPMYKYNS
ncbi:hypothetical protein [Candidatus Thioglobus sp. NP1]